MRELRQQGASWAAYATLGTTEEGVDEANGCMWMVRRSHVGVRRRWTWYAKVRRCPDVSRRPWSRCRDPWLPATSTTITASLRYRNRSKKPQRANGYHFKPEESVYVEAGDHIKKPFITVADGERFAGAAFPRTFPIS